MSLGVAHTVAERVALEGHREEPGRRRRHSMGDREEQPGGQRKLERPPWEARTCALRTA